MMLAFPNKTELSPARVHNRERVSKIFAKQSLFLSQAEIQSPTEFIITSNGTSSLAEFYFSKLADLSTEYFLSNRVIPPQSYPHTGSLPAEYSPAKGQIPSIAIFVHHLQQKQMNYGSLQPVKNTISHTLQTAVRDLFSRTQIITSIFHVHTSWHVHTSLYNIVSFILRTSTHNASHASHMANLVFLSGKILLSTISGKPMINTRS